MRLPQEKEQKTKHHSPAVPECSTVSFLLPVLWLPPVVKMSRLLAFRPSPVTQCQVPYDNDSEAWRLQWVSYEDMFSWWKFSFDHGERVLASVLPSGLWALRWPGDLRPEALISRVITQLMHLLPHGEASCGPTEYPPSNLFSAFTLCPPPDNWWQARSINSLSDDCLESQAGSGFFLPCYFLPYTWMYTKQVWSHIYSQKPYIR